MVCQREIEEGGKTHRRGKLFFGARCSHLEALPEMEKRKLPHQHTLSGGGPTTIVVRRGAANRLSFAIQLCLRSYPGSSGSQDVIVFNLSNHLAYAL